MPNEELGCLSFVFQSHQFSILLSAISTSKYLKLEVVVAKPYTPTTTTTSLVLPEELPSVEEQLKDLVAVI